MEESKGLKWNWTPVQMLEKTAELKKYCMANYARGGDTMIECWDDAQWISFLVSCDMFWREPKECLDELMGLYHERERAVQNEVF